VDIPLNEKNLHSVVQVGALVGLSVIPLFVESSHLGWHRWQFAIVGLAVLGIGAVIRQAILQSREDEKREVREKDRDARETNRDALLERLAESIKNAVLPPITETAPVRLAEEDTKKVQEIDSELRRIFIYPRIGVSYQLFREVWKASGHHSENPKVDCDILVLMCIVNTSSQTKYIQDITASVIESGARKSLERQGGFQLEILGKDMEYGFENEGHRDSEEPDPLTPLLDRTPVQLSPQQLIEGWVRFILKDADPENIDSDSWTFAIIDSLEHEFPIKRTSDKPKKGEIALRRRQSGG
jgi:hypothetical protein